VYIVRTVSRTALAYVRPVVAATLAYIVKTGLMIIIALF